MTYMVWDFSIEISTQSLSVFNISDKTQNRLEWLLSLRNNGFSNKEMSDYINAHGILSPKVKKYSPKLIWVTLKKYENRIKRLKEYEITNVVERLIIK
ncbi:hypothetical protein N9D98_02750 [Amylibacter sp.]|nr:hypothetical protein [Amylibacter sp.]